MSCARCEAQTREWIDALKEHAERMEQIAEVLSEEHDNASLLCNWLALKLAYLVPDFYDTLLDEEERELFDAVAPLGLDDEAEDDG